MDGANSKNSLPLACWLLPVFLHHPISRLAGFAATKQGKHTPSPAAANQPPPEMADYYQHGGRTMPYSNTDECYDTDRHGTGSRRMYSHTTDEYYGDADRRRPVAAYGYGDDCYNGGARQGAVYSDEYSRGGGYGGEQQEQQYYKREEKEHKQKERLGEFGALAGGAFALYEGHRAKKDPEHAQRHKIEAGVATAAALGAGGYAYHEHREQKEARYEGKEHRVPHGYYCN